MPANRNKRLRQYKKVRDYCNKRIVGKHLKTYHEHELLLCILTRAVVAVFNGCSVSHQEVIRNLKS
jgi:hypothetical protein